jgi:hypothetical protein
MKAVDQGRPRQERAAIQDLEGASEEAVSTKGA